jgi:hypothetical protein
MYKSQTFPKGSILFLVTACGILFSSCTEKISGVGSGYLRDTITSGINAFSDSSALSFRPVTKRTVSILGRTFAINTAASALFFGKVQSEGVESWAAMKIPILPPDTIGQILTDTLILRIRFGFHYGDPADGNIDFSVWTESNNIVNDSTSTLTQLNLVKVVGSYHGTVTADTVSISIGLDTSTLNPLLRTASLALVLVPNTSMNTIRAFASNENGDITFAPHLKFSIKGVNDTTTIIRYPTNDFHIVMSDNPSPGGEFLLRGSYASREKIVINIKNIRNQLQLNPFTTINSALLEVRSDSKLHTTSSIPVDTTGPSLAYIPNTSVADSGHTFVAYGVHGATDVDLYSFQVQSLVEHALRVGDDSLVLELRAGFALRTIAGSTVDVEDYNVNKWIMYGMDYADKTKRPKLVITYSYLR